MRRKKHKQVRRAMRFYRIQHGFRPPYKVIVDGNFVNAVAVIKQEDITALLTKMLGDKVRVFTTPCVMHEVRKMGSELSEARAACKRCALHHCGHDDKAKLPAADCLAAQIEGGNPNHFLVATQDRTLQRRLMAMPGGAVLFASVNGVGMETPSTTQRAAAADGEKERLGASSAERRTLEAIGGEEGDVQEARQAFRRHKAKGPNPLAVRPKAKKPTGPPRPKAPEAGASEEKKRKRVRRAREPSQGGAEAASV